MSWFKVNNQSSHFCLWSTHPSSKLKFVSSSISQEVKHYQTADFCIILRKLFKKNTFLKDLNPVFLWYAFRNFYNKLYYLTVICLHFLRNYNTVWIFEFNAALHSHSFEIHESCINLQWNFCTQVCIMFAWGTNI